MERDRIDLSPLDPQDDALAYERLVRRIMAAAAPELARRAAGTTPLALVVGWARPTLAAAAAIAAIAIGALVITDRDTAPDPVAVNADALGLPAPAAEWLDAGREPTASDLMLAMEER